MPQLDKLSFVPQLFWLVVFFLGLYVIVSEVILPKINVIFQVRDLKALMHNARVSSLEKEKSTNNVNVTMFDKLFSTTSIFVEYLKRYNALTPQDFGTKYYNSLKSFRLQSAQELESAYIEMQVKRGLTKKCLKN